MESYHIKPDFNHVLDYNLTSLVCCYLNLDDIMRSVIGLNKSYNDMLKNKLDIVWKALFSHEFMQMEYKDHKR